MTDEGNRSGLRVIRVAVRALRHDLRTWPELLAADLATRVAATLVIAPATAWIVRQILRSGGTGALTDQDVLRFALSPVGLGTLVAVGAASAVAGLVGHAAIMTVLAGIEENRAVSWRDGMRHAVDRFLALFELTVRGLIRLLLPTTPFLLLAAGAFVLLLGEYDINYYLTARPPNFWIAALLLLVAAIGIAWAAGRRLLSWAVALPRLLFGGASPVGALEESASVTSGHRFGILGLFLVWATLSITAAVVVTGAAGLLGRLLVPEGTENLSVMAAGVGVAVVVGSAANLLLSMVSSITLATFVFELDRRLSERWSLPHEVTAEPGTLARRAPLRVPGRIWELVVLLVALGAVASSMRLVRDVRARGPVEVTAHRGSSGRAPENTLAAVRAAIADSADWVEIDVQETSDGVVVVHHDEDFMRAAGDPRRIWETPWAEVDDVASGAWFGPEFEAERVPRLADVLRVARGRIGVNIELKVYGHGQRLEERTIEEVEAAGMEDQVVLMSGDRSTVETLSLLRPDWTIGLLSTVAIGDLGGIDADFLAVNVRAATPGFVRRAHAAGKRVHVWTVDHPAQMSSVVSAGADVLITDEPALAREVLAQLRALSPAARLLLVAGARFGIVPGATRAPTADEA